MNSFACSLLALVAVAAISGAQLASGHKIEVRRLGDRATFATGYHFDVSFSGSVGELKQRIASAYQMPIEKLHVFYWGNGQPDSFVLDPFADFTSDEQQPYLVVDFNLIKVVKPDGGELFLACEESDTIADLKKKIDRLDDIPSFLQRLMQGDQELPDSKPVAGLLSEEGTALKLVVEAKQD